MFIKGCNSLDLTDCRSFTLYSDKTTSGECVDPVSVSAEQLCLEVSDWIRTNCFLILSVNVAQKFSQSAAAAV